MLGLDKIWWREYLLPIVIALSLHLLLLIFITADFGSTQVKPLVKRPQAMQAKLIRLQEKKPKQQKNQPKRLQKETSHKKEDQKKKKSAQLKKQRAEKAAKDKALKATNARKVKAKKDKAIKDKALKDKALKEKALKQQEIVELEKKRLIREAKEQEEADQLSREAAFMDDFAEEQVLLESSADEVEAMSYIAVIQQAIRYNWNRPASARNGMKVTLKIGMFPNGQINSVNIAKGGGSGNAAFDRSAITAVEKTERIPELSDLKAHVFEKYYRSFKIEFRPEDLRL